MRWIRGACRLAQTLGASLLAPALAFALVITSGSALDEACWDIACGGR